METLTKFKQFVNKIDHCDFTGFKLTESLKRQVANEALTYEECDETKEELLSLSDEALTRKYYSINLDYCRSKGLCA